MELNQKEFRNEDTSTYDGVKPVNIRQKLDIDFKNYKPKPGGDGARL